MKPPPFLYARPESLDEVLRLLAEGDGGARVLAGGQSLIPLLNFRLARPEVLVDIAMVHELSRLTIEDGVLRIGASVTQRAVETSGDVARHCPLLSKALPLVGHLQNRARGTVVGSIAHADPSAELPAVALVLDAAMLVRSAATERIIPADEFFLGPFTTVLEPDEMLVEVRFPAETTARAAITEIAPRSGDFALAGVAGKLTTTDDGRIQDVALALVGVGAAPPPPGRATRGPPPPRHPRGPAGRMFTPIRPTGLGWPASWPAASWRRWPHEAGTGPDRRLGGIDGGERPDRGTDRGQPPAPGRPAA